MIEKKSAACLTQGGNMMNLAFWVSTHCKGQWDWVLPSHSETADDCVFVQVRMLRTPTDSHAWLLHYQFAAILEWQAVPTHTVMMIQVSPNIREVRNSLHEDVSILIRDYNFSDMILCQIRRTSKRRNETWWFYDTIFKFIFIVIYFRHVVYSRNVKFWYICSRWYS